MTSVASFLSAGIVTGSAASPVTPGGSGSDRFTGPANPLVRLTVTLTSRLAPRFTAPLLTGATASVPGAGFTVIVIAAAGKKALMFCGLATLAVSVAFLSAAAFAAAAAFGCGSGSGVALSAGSVSSAAF